VFYIWFVIAELESLLREFHERIKGLEGDKWDLDHAIKMRDYQVTISSEIQRDTNASRLNLTASLLFI